MPVKLRPFQGQIERDVYAAWEQTNNGNVMPVAATGSGKTVLLSKLLYDEPGASVAIAHRQELVSQIATALARNGVRHRLLGAKKGSPLTRVITALQVAELGCSYLDPNAKTGVGGVDTVIRLDQSDPWFKQVRLKVQDEAHHVLKANKWGQADAMFPNARGLLPTATPIRADGKGLGRWADGLVDAMVLAPSMREIINMGYLTDYKIYAPPSDFQRANVGISENTGELKQDELSKARKASTITGDVVEHYLKLAAGKLGVTFDTDVESATETAAAFRARGVPAEVVSAKTPDALRANILQRFKNRELLQLVNVDLFGEGFDLPAIEVVSFARATESFALYSQQFGRALRLLLEPSWLANWDSYDDATRRYFISISSKPVAIIIDHVGNVKRHGLPDAVRNWYDGLERRDRRSAKKSDAIPLRYCHTWEDPTGFKHVGCTAPYERVLKSCPYCGTQAPPPAERSAPEFVDGDLLELDPATLAQLRGEIDRISGDFHPPAGLPWPAQMAARSRWMERQDAHNALRNSIAWWAGLEAAQGRGESESYRRFFFKFGTDVASAQTLSSKEAAELTERINKELGNFGIDGTVDATAYFANQ